MRKTLETSKARKAPAKRRTVAKRESRASEDAITLLKADHARVKKLFARAEKLDAGDVELTEIVRETCGELDVHARVEEEIVYPAFRAAFDDEELIEEAVVEHDTAKALIAKLRGMDPRSETFKATFKVLGEYIDHHVQEEQEEMFPKARKARVDTRALGAAIVARKRELLREAAVNGTKSNGTRSRSETSDRRLGRQANGSRRIPSSEMEAS